MSFVKSFKKMPFKTKLALVVMPVLVVALVVGYFVTQQQTSTESQASGCTGCFKQCEEEFGFTGHSSPNPRGYQTPFEKCMQSCRDRCEAKPAVATKEVWKMKKKYRPLFCTTADAAIGTAELPDTKAEYKALRDEIVEVLKVSTDPLAVQLKKKVNGFGDAGMKKSYQLYCVEDDNTEDGSEEE